MNFTKQEKYLIIAQKEYSQLLYHFKEEKPFLDIQIITKSDLLNLLSFSYQKDPIPYLLSKEKYDYSSLKKILNILRIGDIKNVDKFEKIYEDLSKNGYIKSDLLGKKKVSQRKVVLFECEEDFELKEFLKRNGIEFDFLSFKDIGRIPLYEKNKGPVIYNFDNKFLQFLYIFSDIRKEIIDHEEKKDSITLFIKDNNDLFYVNFFSKLFNLPVCTKIKMQMITDNEVSKAVKTFYENENFIIDGEVKPNTSLEVLKNTIEEYNLQNIDFKFAYSSLMEILSSKTYDYVYQDRGVRLTNQISFDPFFDDDHIIYVSDFEFGEFYKEFDDNNVLSDAELEKIGVNPSYIKTRLDRKLKLNFLMYHRFGLLSRVLLHLKDKIYSSQFEKEMGWKSKKPETKHNPDGVYTKEALRMIDAYYKDIGHYKADDEYRNYQHKFDVVKNVKKKTEFSVTGFDTMFKCPYLYYLEKIVGISKYDTNQDFVDRNRGVLIHKVFEDIYTRDYSDFDKAYEEAFNLGVEAYKENNPNKEMTLEEEVYLEFVHKWLKDIVKKVLEQKEHANIESENAEQEVNFTLPSTDYRITGKIDKIVHTVGNTGQKYYTIIDYKTGKSGSFEIEKCFLGGSLQLPLYEISLKDRANKHLTSNGTEDYGGFGVQHIYFPNKIPVDKDKASYDSKAILNTIKIKGIAFSDKDYFASFDNTLLKIKTNQKSGSFLDIHNTFTNNDCYVTSIKDYNYSYTEFQYDVIKAAKDSIEKILSNDFKIAPTVVKTSYFAKEQCIYCQYKNICYHSKEDVVDLSKKMKLKFSNDIVEYENEQSESEDDFYE